MLKSTQQTTGMEQRGAEDTFPKLLSRNRQTWGNQRVALRKKRHGLWNQYTWEDCYEKVVGIFRGLVGLGLQPGDNVAILGDDDPEWFWAEIAVQAAGGTVIGVSPKFSVDETRQLLIRSQPRLVILHDQEQVDKLLELRKELPSVQRAIYWSEKGLRHYDDPLLMSLEELMRRGEEACKGDSSDFEERVAQGSGDDVALILCLASDSEPLKEIPVTHGLLLSSARTVLSSDPAGINDEYVSLMNPGWFFEQVQGFAVSLLSGRRVNFAENLDTARADFREVSPHTLTYPSPMWDRLALAIQHNVAGASRVKRGMFKGCLCLGLKVADRTLEGRGAGVFNRALYFLVDWVEFRPLRDKHGMDRARVAYAAGSTVSPETMRFFHAVGVNLKQVYATPESGVVLTDPGVKGLD